MALSFRDYKKKFNPATGKFQFQHWTGGEYFNNITDINPNLLKGGITGSGHPARKHTAKIGQHFDTAEEEATHIGNEILSRLKMRSGQGVVKNTIDSRIQNLIKGTGLQIN